LGLSARLTTPCQLRIDGQTNRIAPSVNVTTPANATESDRVSVSGGNPALQATRSRNLDFSVEYYLQSIGVVSTGYFHKDLDGPIYRRTFDGTYEGQPARFTVFDNAGKARVSGWEFVYQQPLSVLPSPFDGLGLYANFTLVASAVTSISSRAASRATTCSRATRSTRGGQ
jgi:outer membrane receptor protein involved in Fe transport